MKSVLPRSSLSNSSLSSLLSSSFNSTKQQQQQFKKNYETVDRPRTNNNVEGYNSKLKKYVGAAKPNIFKAINVFQQEEVNSTLKYTQALAGANIPVRRKLDVDKDGHLRTFKRLLVNKDITLEVYIRNIIELYSFPALEPKEKKKKSTDTASVSQDDSDSDDSDDLNEIDSEDSDSDSE